MTVATVGAKGRGLWRFSLMHQVMMGGPREAELVTRGDLTEWMVMTDYERHEALHRHFREAYDRHRLMTSAGPAPLRRPRTALGLCHACPIAPPSSAIYVRIRLPDGTERDLHAEEVAAGTWTARHPETGDAYVFSSGSTPPRG